MATPTSTPAPDPDSERWRRIEQLIDGALDLPLAERARWLHQACGDDVDLLDEVNRLLEAGERPDAFLAQPLPAIAPGLGGKNRTADDRPAAPLPVRVGPYRIIREIGRGGMGTVFLAEREEHFHQRVAVKVIRRGLHADEQLVRRFIEERQLLASLEHANIAHVLDGGVTDDGVPWFAMELVEGEPIDRWCDERCLTIDARLELLCTVCDAIEYAHSRQIIHRDIKPSNILVRADGTVKLLDFGIAKLVAPDVEAEPGLTRTGQRMLTPEYASPEQVRGDRVSARSDVYSLGVLAYELLTGRRPYRTTGGAERELVQAVLEQEPHRPLRGTLDAIVLKALAKDPERRYASAKALKDDVQAYLQGRRVRIAPSRPRRWSAILTAASLVVAATLFVTLTRWRGLPTATDTRAAPVIAIGLISDFRGSDSAALAQPLAELLATNLARVPSLRTISNARLYELMAQLGAPDAPNAGAYSAAARRAGASMLVDGSLYALESGGYRLDLRRIDVTTGDVLAVHTVSGKDIFALVDSGTTRLTAAIGGAAPRGSIADVTTHSAVAYRFYEEGLRAYYRGDGATARSVFQASLAEDSTLAMAAYYLARSHENGEIRLRWMRRALDLAAQASDRERLIIRMAWATWTSDPAAVAVAETLTVRYPEELEGHFFAGQALAEAGDYPAALRRMRHVVATDSLALAGSSARCVACDARTRIVEIYIAMDSAAAAEGEARSWTALQPDRAPPWLNLARVQALLGKTDEARQAYLRATEFDPTLQGRPDFLTLRSVTDGNYESLDRDLREIIETGPQEQRLDAHWQLAISLRYQGRYREALAEARSYRAFAAKVNPSTPSVSFAPHEAQVLLELGRYRQSAALFDSIAETPTGISPSHRARFRTLELALGASALAAAGDTTRIASLIDTIRIVGAQSLLARDARLHHHVRGLLLASRGQGEPAVAEFRQAMVAPSSYTRTNYELARTLLRLGRPREAVAALQPALRGNIEGSNLYVTRTELHELLAQAWDAVGQTDSALVHYRSVLRAWRQPDLLLQSRVVAAHRRVASLETGRRR